MTPTLEERFWEYIERIVAAAPQFTRGQVDQLRALLEPARHQLAAAADEIDSASEPFGAAAVS